MVIPTAAGMVIPTAARMVMATAAAMEVVMGVVAATMMLVRHSLRKGRSG